MNKKFFFLGLFCILLNSVIATEAITIDMVTVGNTNNPPDTAVMNDNTTGYGSVSYPFQIGKYEITTGQSATFLNAVARIQILILFVIHIRELKLLMIPTLTFSRRLHQISRWIDLDG